MRSHLLTVAALGSLLLVLSGLAACGGTSTVAGPEQPVIAKDDDGVAIAIPSKAPQRIISLQPSNSDILGALKVDNRVIAVDSLTDYPADLAAKPKVTDAYGKANVEQIIALKPDLVLAYGHFTLDADKQLRQAHIPVVAIPVSDLTGTLKEVQLIGQLVHAEDTAHAVVADMQRRIDAVRAKVKGLPPVSVYMEVGYTSGQAYAFGGGTFGDEVLRDAGGTNVFGSNTSSGGYPQVNDESVISANPQVIILTEDPQYGGDPAQVVKRPGWSAITAVKDQHVYQIASDLTEQQDPRLVDGLEQIAKALHPDAFK